MPLINSPLEFKQALRAGPYAWPGCYPLFFICDGGGALCCACAREEVRNIFSALLRKQNDGWRVIGQDVNWEDADLTCDHCNKQIESAYGED
jgi:hypothetical protein